MKMLKILGVLMLIGMVASVLLGGRNSSTQNNETTSQVKTLTDDERRQAENDRKIAEAQAEYDKSNRPNTISTNEVVSSQGVEMGFEKCVEKQREVAASMLGTDYNAITVANTNDLSVMKFCTDDGAVLSTCSRLDSKSITTKTDNRTGCAN